MRTNDPSRRCGAAPVNLSYSLPAPQRRLGGVVRGAAPAAVDLQQQTSLKKTNAINGAMFTNMANAGRPPPFAVTKTEFDSSRQMFRSASENSAAMAARLSRTAPLTEKNLRKSDSEQGPVSLQIPSDSSSDVQASVAMSRLTLSPTVAKAARMSLLRRNKHIGASQSVPTRTRRLGGNEGLMYTSGRMSQDPQSNPITSAAGDIGVSSLLSTIRQSLADITKVEPEFDPWMEDDHCVSSPIEEATEEASPPTAIGTLAPKRMKKETDDTCSVTSTENGDSFKERRSAKLQQLLAETAVS
jgi:hypothetical protein